MLRGFPVGREGDSLLLDVGGVGYELHCTARAIEAIPSDGTALTLSVETIVREDMIRLHGFADAAERQAFRILTGVQGVGARVASSILSELSPSDIAAAVAAGDHKSFARAQGVGPKLAQRLVADLKGKEFPASGPVSAPVGRAAADAVEALTRLGYRPAKAQDAVAEAAAQLGPDAGAEAIVGLALRFVSRAA